MVLHLYPSKRHARSGVRQRTNTHTAQRCSVLVARQLLLFMIISCVMVSAMGQTTAEVQPQQTSYPTATLVRREGETKIVTVQKTVTQSQGGPDIPDLPFGLSILGLCGVASGVLTLFLILCCCGCYALCNMGRKKKKTTITDVEQQPMVGIYQDPNMAILQQQQMQMIAQQQQQQNEAQQRQQELEMQMLAMQQQQQQQEQMAQSQEFENMIQQRQQQQLMLQQQQQQQLMLQQQQQQQQQQMMGMSMGMGMGMGATAGMAYNQQQLQQYQILAQKEQEMQMLEAQQRQIQMAREQEMRRQSQMQQMQMHRINSHTMGSDGSSLDIEIGGFAGRSQPRQSLRQVLPDRSVDSFVRPVRLGSVDNFHQPARNNALRGPGYDDDSDTSIGARGGRPPPANPSVPDLRIRPSASTAEMFSGRTSLRKTVHKV